MTKYALVLVGLLLTVTMCLHLLQRDVLGVDIRLPFVDELERQAYDYKVNLSAREELDTRVVIIDIDERTLQAHGQWPLSRAVYAQLLDQLFDKYKVDSVGFDVTFPEPESRHTESRIAKLAETNPTSEQLLSALANSGGDVLMANAMQGRSVVLGSVFQVQIEGQGNNPSVGQLPKPLFENSEYEYPLILAETLAPKMQRYTANIPELASAASATGFFSIAEQVADKDGVIRRIELIDRFEDKLYANLALQLIQVYTFDEAQPLLLSNPNDTYWGLEGLQTILSDIPLDEEAAVYVPYAKAGAGYEYVPATDVIKGVYQGDLEGAIILVGTSASGLVDLRNTPVSANLPGVEVHANVVSAVLDENFRVKPLWVNLLNLLILGVVGVLFSIFLPRLSAFWGTALFVFLCVSAIGVNWYFWSEKLMILSIAPLLLFLGVFYFLDMVTGFFSESQARRMTQKMFGMYVPPEVVGEISTTTDIFSMKSQKREMSVLFCDIRDFTTISEAMEPEDLSEWLNNFLTPMTKIIHKHGGAIDKYMGDAIMAFWGAPMKNENHAANAVSAALEMMQHISVLNKQNRKLGRPEIRIGAGINTGDMSVGNMGSEFRMAYTVVGDAVNLGSRLEGLTKEYGVEIIVSEFTKAAAPNFSYVELDTVKVKGKNLAVTIFNPKNELAAS